MFVHRRIERTQKNSKYRERTRCSCDYSRYIRLTSHRPVAHQGSSVLRHHYFLDVTLGIHTIQDSFAQRQGLADAEKIGCRT
jgi:hypothetical protein